MGWGLKIGFLFVALLAAAFGAWIITVPIMLPVFFPPILNRRGKKKGGQSEQAGKGGGTPLLSMVGGLLVVLSLVAILSGGTLSPIVLAVSGFALSFRQRLSIPGSTRVAPVKDSILLRGRFAPFRWSALAEAKVSTRDLEGALSGLSERLVFTSNPKPRIFVAFAVTAPSRRSAEKALVGRIRAASRSLVPLGVYLLPLDSAEAWAVSNIRARRMEPVTPNLKQRLSSENYEALAVEAQHGFVTRFDLYEKSDEGRKGCSAFSPLRGENRGQLTLREFLHEARVKLGSPHPDGYVAFLSSMAATEGEALGQRITETVQSGQEQALLVTSLGNPPVELSRTQLRAVSSIYG